MKPPSIVWLGAMADAPPMLSDPVDETISSEPEGAEGSTADGPVFRDLLNNFEKNVIAAALLAADGSQKRAAAALGVLPTTLQGKMKRFGLTRGRLGPAASNSERHSGTGHGPAATRDASNPTEGGPE